MKIKVLLASAILATVFVACEKETDTDPGNGTGTGTGTGSSQDTIAPTLSGYSINSLSSRVFAPVGSDIDVAFDAADNEDLQYAVFGVSLSLDGFGELSQDWAFSDLVPISGTSYSYSNSFEIPTTTNASRHWAIASVLDKEQLEASKSIQVIVTKAGQAAISLPDNPTNSPYTVSLQASPSRFDLKARFDDGDALVYRRLEIEPKLVEAGKDAFYYDFEEEVTGLSSNRTYVNVIPDSVATGLYEFTLSAGDSDGNVTFFFGELNITD
jgi:hypothetical protein